MDNKLFVTRKAYRILSIIIVITILYIPLLSVISAAAENETTLDTEDYIKSAKLYYKLKTGNEWIEVTEENTESIPGNASMKLDISYANVPIEDLLNSNRQMSYILPEQLKNSIGNNSFISDNNDDIIGKITSKENNLIILEFYENWLSEQKKNSEYIDGHFAIETDINWLKADEHTIKISDNITITANFDNGDKMLAENGTADIKKSSPVMINPTSTDSSYYLEYTLTVTAGDEGAGGVKVVDEFTQNSQYISEYYNVTETETEIDTTTSPKEEIARTYSGTDNYESQAGKVYLADSYTAPVIPSSGSSNITKPGVMVWNIGNMTPNEVRTLTYKVKLDEAYITSASKDTVANTADVYSTYQDKTYNKKSQSSTYTPSVKTTVSKTVIEQPSMSNNGKYIIEYKILVSNDCSYDLTNLRIRDYFSFNNKSYLQYANYIDNSLKLYNGDSTDNTNQILPLPLNSEGNNVIINNDINDSSDKKYFEFYIGSIQSNAKLTVTYQVSVDPELFIKLANNAETLKNNVELLAGDDDNPNILAQKYNVSQSLQKTWDRKIAGEPTTEQITVNISGADSYYDATGSTIIEIAAPTETSFTVPQNSFQYKAMVNENCDWDVQEASIKDTLTSTYLKFAGYVKVEAYNEGINYVTPNDSTAVLSYFDTLKPVETVWIKIDGKQSFSFTPQEIGLTGKYAYRLTYYARPNDVDNITQVYAINKLQLSGNVSPVEGQTMVISATATQKVTVKGDYGFDATKMAWYYAPDDTEWVKDSNEYISENGTLYWAIKVDGTYLPEGTQFKDIPVAANGIVINTLTNTASTTSMKNYIREYSFVGAYMCNLDRNTEITDFENLSKFQENIYTDYTSYFSSSADTTANTLVLSLGQGIAIPDEQSLYIVIRTEPEYKPNNDRDALRYSNKLQNKTTSSNTWIDNNTVTNYDIYKNGEYFKELGCVFSYDGTKITYLNSYQEDNTTINQGTITNNTINSKIKTKLLKDTDSKTVTGTFAAWQIHLNYSGDLSGKYRIIDTIPDGMELVYVRYFWYGNAITNDSIPKVVEIPEFESNPSYTRFETNETAENKGTQTCIYYYNEENRQAIWDVDNLQKFTGDISVSDPRDQYSVEFQVVCRVTDPDILFGTETEDKATNKGFENIIEVSQDGQSIGTSDSDTVFFKTGSPLTSFDKTLTNPNVNNGILDFKIEVNKLEEDLLPDNDTITLVDKLSNNLILDTETLKVVDKNNKSVDFKASVTEGESGQILKLELPDNKHLIITYQTVVHAPPSTEISFNNDAYWESYPSTKSSYFENNYSYTVSSSASGGGTPAIEVLKVDKSDISNRLSGADFQLQKVTYNSETNSFEPVTDSEPLSGTTDENGTCTFSDIETNTIYCLTETSPPSGYILDSTPHYIAFKISTDGTFPDIPETALENIDIYYLKATKKYTVYNSPREPIVMPSTGGISINVFMIGGGCIIFISVCLFIFSQRRKYN